MKDIIKDVDDNKYLHNSHKIAYRMLRYLDFNLNYGSLIAKKENVRPITVTDRLKRLQKNGLIERKSHKKGVIRRYKTTRKGNLFLTKVGLFVMLSKMFLEDKDKLLCKIDKLNIIEKESNYNKREK